MTHDVFSILNSINKIQTKYEILEIPNELPVVAI